MASVSDWTSAFMQTPLLAFRSPHTCYSIRFVPTSDRLVR